MSTTYPKGSPEAEALEQILRAKADRADTLDLSDLRLTTLPPELGQCTALQTLFLRNNQLTTLPPELGRCTALSELDLSDNRLTRLPPELGQCTALQTLYLYNNLLTTLPPELGRCTALQKLFLSSNRLTQLPPELGRCTALEVASLDNNQLTTLPEELGKCTALLGLRLDNNQLTTLPSELGQCTALKELHLNDNQLTTLPPDLGKSTALQWLDLSNNHLMTLPLELSQLTQLKVLFLHGNPQLSLPEDVLGPSSDDVYVRDATLKPARDILAYYFRTQRAARPLNEVKLILVGRGMAGKTSIVRRLVENKFDPKEKETPGIRILQWQQRCGADRVRFNIWDFAGQEITHATHQFFLTARSVYVLVLTGRDGVQNWDADYWLGLIRSFASDAPVIVALNQQGVHPFDVDEFPLRERYPFIRAFVKTDCKSRKGMAELEQEITATVAGMESVRRSFPAEWVAIKDQLSGMKVNYLSYLDYRQQCTALGEKDEEAQDQLSRCLHELGLALNYSDDARLRDKTVLNPHWVTNGIYALLRAAFPRRSVGELHLADVKAVLPKEPPEMREYLVELMRRFELCFPIAQQERVYLVPQKLEQNQPRLDAAWATDGTALRLRYLYSALPEGLLPRFIVRTYALSEGQTRWRHGVVLELDAATALVRGDTFKKDKVEVVVRGAPEDQVRLVAIVRQHLADIHADLQGLKPREEMEMQGHPGVYQTVTSMEQGERKHPLIIVGTNAGDVEVNRPHELNRIVPETARSGAEPWIKVFVSYSKSDERHRARFRQHLTILEAHRLIYSFWDDKCLVAGEPWDEVIQQKLAEADIVVLLVSTPFLATDYIRRVEMQTALARAGKGESKVVPVILEPCGWLKESFAQYVSVPTKARAMCEWKPQSKGWHAVEESLRTLIEELNRRRAKGR